MKSAEDEGAEVEETERKYYPLTLGDSRLEVEAAVTKLEMKTGLMHRETLPDDKGMLFIYPKPAKLRFWMKDTSIPLDIGYFDRFGKLREIHHLQPYDLDPISAKKANIQYALEVPNGWFKKEKLSIGAQLKLSEIRAILDKRGRSPEAYRIPPSDAQQ